MSWHICYSKKEITREFIKLYKEEIKSVGMKCSTCGKDLKIGDFVDGFYPYEIEYNICKKCYLDRRNDV